MLAYLRQEFKYFSVIGPKAAPRDFEILKQNETFKLSLGVYVDVQTMNKRTLNKAMKASIDLLDMINLRLERIDS